MRANYLYVICLAFVFCFSCKAKTEERPNILWITIEDTSPQFIGCYGNENASTPVIDKLAKEGVRFTNAFSTGTVCSASRSTIITGVPTYKMGTGHQRSHYAIPNYIKGFPYYLQQLGYYTSNNVKTDYNIANEKDFVIEAWDESSDTASWNGRGDNQPFFSVFNFPESHQSRTMSWSFDLYEKHVLKYLSEDERIADDAFDMPPFYNDTPEMRKQFARVYNSIKLTDNRIGELLHKLEGDGLKENTIVFFYADHGEGIPRAKTTGINLGYRVPFIVWFPEKFKHLSPWGTSDITNQLVSFEDLAPSIIHLLGGEVPDLMAGSTIFNTKNKKKKNHLLLSTDRVDNGLDLVRSITDGRFMYSRNFMPFIPEVRYINYLEIADITKQMRKDLKDGKLSELQKSVFNPRSSESLYDIENDIWETKNLVTNPGYKPVLEKMRKQLHTAVLKSNDIHFMTEYEMSKISENQTPYEYRLDKTKYDFESIYKAASLSGKKGTHIVELQMGLLNHENNIVKYWASIGLMSQDIALLKPYKDKLNETLNDEYAPVSITISALLYDKFKSKKGASVLNEFSKSRNKFLALMAINYMLYTNDKTAFINTITELNKQKNLERTVKNACKDFLEVIKQNNLN